MENLNDKPKEECGIFGIYSKEIKKDILKTMNYSLYALQHRGQESAGVTISNNKNLFTYKSMGFVSDLFTSDIPKDAEGNIAIGHVRYSTTGESEIENAQPLVKLFSLGQISIAHNGNLTNADVLRNELEKNGAVFNGTSDTEIIIKLIARKTINDFIEGIKESINLIEGSFSLVIVVAGKLIGIRDPHGIRPLCLGTNSDGDYFLASESCALDAVNAELVRDIEAGEMIIIDDSGVQSLKYSKENVKYTPCIFEYIYFARPESNIDGINVYDVRFKSGILLAKKNTVDADMVIGIQDSGTIAALGFSQESKIPYNMGLIKNRYIGRTFIMPEQSSREEKVKLKFSPLKHLVNGKRVILIDDSLVRGTTSKILIDIVRRAGAKEVHFRSASPVIKSPCYYGVNISTKKELIGAKFSVEEIRKQINADSLEYLSIEDMFSVLNNKNYCIGCFNGEYPTDVPNS